MATGLAQEEPSAGEPPWQDTVPVFRSETPLEGVPPGTACADFDPDSCDRPPQE